MKNPTIFQTAYFWHLNGFELIEEPLYSYRDIVFKPDEVKRVNPNIPLTDEIIYVFNRFHLRYPIECWENYEEICDFNEKMKELF